VERVDAVLGSLHADVVVDSVRPVHPEVRRRGGAAGKGYQHAAGDVALGQSHLRRLRAVHVYAEDGLLHYLVHMHVGGAGNTRDPGRQLLRYLVVRFSIATDYLQVNRRRQPEIQDLARDIGRLKEEDHIRESAMKALAEHYFVVAGGAVFFLVQRDEDLAIGA